MTKHAMITENVRRIKSELPAGVLLLAATKTQDAGAVQAAVRAGVDACGENRMQELLVKNEQGAYAGAPLHFIGRLQKNKVKQAVGVCDLIESVDSPELLRLIDARAGLLGITQKILLEVNIAKEESKAGISPEELPVIMEALADFSNILVAGLMTIPPISEKPGGNKSHFAAMRELFIDIKRKKYDNSSMGLLSMGMSGDYMDAVAEGANLVRVGSAIFGARTY